MASLSCMNSIKRAGDQRPTAVRPPAVILFDGTWDRSGSTSNIYHAQMLGLQKCVSDRREDAAKTGARCLVSITTFDDEAETFTSEWSDDGDEYATGLDLFHDGWGVWSWQRDDQKGDGE